MSFFGNLTSAVVKTALSPIAVVADVASVATGGSADNTKKLIDSAVSDAKQACEDGTDWM